MIESPGCQRHADNDPCHTVQRSMIDETAHALLADEPIGPRFKGFPQRDGVTVGTIGDQGWNILNGDFHLPIMVLKRTALEHNIGLMARWCTQSGVSLAPHGKTTMAPQLFAMQLQAGAWGITAATMSQVRLMRAFGVERILLANELVEPSAVRWIAGEQASDPTLDFYCLVDSVAGVALLTRVLQDCGGGPLQVLVEMGLSGGRTGCRSIKQAIEVADAARASSRLVLAGVEGYEGLVHAGDEAHDLAAVDAFLGEIRVLTERLHKSGAFDGREEVIVTAGGSAFFDRVAEQLGGIDATPQVRVVIRSGCYVTHDAGLYKRRSPLADRSRGPDRLRTAIEVWAAVLSRPEPTRAIVGMGKRDVAHDLELPIAKQIFRGLMRTADPIRVTDINDHHVYLELPVDDPLQPGDLICFDIVHPCTTFDKWQLVPIVDDDYSVAGAVRVFL